jgi:hypothetical protein
MPSWFRTLTIYDARDGEQLLQVSIPEEVDDPIPPIVLLRMEWEEFGKAQWFWTEKHNPTPEVPQSDEVLTQMGKDAARDFAEKGFESEIVFAPDKDLRVEWTIEPTQEFDLGGDDD